MRIVKVDVRRCEGHGKCYRLAPDLFTPTTDHGHSKFIGEPIGPGDTQEKLAEDAIGLCPEFALSWKPVDPSGTP